MVKLSKPASSWSELEKLLQPIINEAMLDEVSTAAKLEEQEHVQEDIYNSGIPIIYKRRGFGVGSRGLGDISQMESTLIENGTVEIVNKAEPQAYWDTPNSLATNIELGYGNKWYSVSRPFQQKTVESLEQNKKHVTALKTGLIKRGLTVI